jgi:hypothetical protein
MRESGLVRGSVLLVLGVAVALTIETSLVEQAEFARYRLALDADTLQFYSHACITCLACAIAPVRVWLALAMALAAGGVGLEFAQGEFTMSRPFEVRDLVISSIGVGTGLCITFALTLTIALIAAGWRWASHGPAAHREMVGRRLP